MELSSDRVKKIHQIESVHVFNFSVMLIVGFLVDFFSEEKGIFMLKIDAIP